MSLPIFWSRTVSLAALAGWVPFAMGFLIVIFPGLSPVDPVVFERALLGYGALILSFLGGVRWGIRLQGGAGSDLTYIVGIFGSVAGFITLLLPLTIGLLILTFGFGIHGLWVVWSGIRGRVPPAYARLRLVMTWLVCVTLVLILIARLLVGQ